jgi:hypothetical protein
VTITIASIIARATLLSSSQQAGNHPRTIQHFVTSRLSRLVVGFPVIGKKMEGDTRSRARPHRCAAREREGPSAESVFPMGKSGSMTAVDPIA